MYCGDGINDLSALDAADVGMAIGSTDASAAAAISNKQASIGGECMSVQAVSACNCSNQYLPSLRLPMCRLLKS